MAHVQKFSRGAVGHMAKHFERAKDENGAYIKFGNTEIDTAKSEQNYNLAPVRSQGKFIKKRCEEVKCLNRKDVNVMCSWVVTLPKSFPAEREKEFFEQTYKFLEEKYGKENTISAYVHKDEVTPHLHFAFVPVVKDKKTELEKVSAYECLNRKELKTFHPALSKYLENYFGFEVEIMNEATKEGNRTVAELKQQTIAEQTQKKQQELDILILKVQDETNRLEELEDKIVALNRKITVDERILRHQDDIDAIGQKSFVGNKIIMSPEEANKLKGMAKDCINLSDKIRHLMIDYEQLKESRQSTIKLNIELGQVKNENEMLKKFLDTNFPDVLKQFEKQKHQRMNLNNEIGDR